MKTYEISFSGVLVITANDPDEAFAKAATFLPEEATLHGISEIEKED
jgi:hypothetical protein